MDYYISIDKLLAAHIYEILQVIEYYEYNNTILPMMLGGNIFLSLVFSHDHTFLGILFLWLVVIFNSIFWFCDKSRNFQDDLIAKIDPEQLNDLLPYLPTSYYEKILMSSRWEEFNIPQNNHALFLSADNYALLDKLIITEKDINNYVTDIDKATYLIETNNLDINKINDNIKNTIRLRLRKRPAY